MPELVIAKLPDDLQKLAGWTIKSCSLLQNSADVGMALELTNHLANCPVRLYIVSGVKFGRAGNIVAANGTLTFRTEDLPPQEEKKS